jgi:RNA polymerase sigma-70 factor (ECF subfamily)
MVLIENETELITRALAGDRLSAERLMERYRRKVTALAYKALRNADDAQDVAQEALVYAHFRLHELRDYSKFVGWLNQITLSLCADYRRRRGTRRLGEPLTVWNEASEDQAFSERLALREALAHLPEAQRTTTMLYYAGGWSLTEVSELLAIPINTVRSRLMAAKRQLRINLGLQTSIRKTMSAQTLTKDQKSLIESAFPSARIVKIEETVEPWQPFAPRVRLALTDGSEKTVDFRSDIDPIRAELIETLHRLGIPGPRIVGSPVAMRGGYLTLCEPPAGENITLWALGGTPHRIRIATERAFEGIDRLQGVTQALLAEPVSAKLARRTLSDEALALTSVEKWKTHEWLNWHESVVEEWRKDPWFADAAKKVQKAVADINEPLVLTSYLHFFPQNYRITPAPDWQDGPLGWPGDDRLKENPLAEFTIPYGHFGDPLLGLAMTWVYDCYPFVHTGFVEEFLWRRNISRREFAPRLALMALQTIARQLPLQPTEKNGWWQAVHGYAEQALDWM